MGIIEQRTRSPEGEVLLLLPHFLTREQREWSTASVELLCPLPPATGFVIRKGINEAERERKMGERDRRA
jgi:hypothetical protein